MNIIKRILRNRKVSRMEEQLGRDEFDNALVTLSEIKRLDPTWEHYTKHVLHIMSEIDPEHYLATAKVEYEANPENLGSISFYCKALEKNGQYVTAFTHSSPLIDSPDATVESMLQRARLCSLTQNYAQAEIACKDIITLVETSGVNVNATTLDGSITRYASPPFSGFDLKTIYNNLGFAQLQIEKYETAIQSFNRALAIDPHYAYAYNNRGYVQLQLGNLDSGREDIEYSLRLEPTNSYAHKNHAVYLLRSGQKPAAREALQRARELGLIDRYPLARLEFEDLLAAANAAD